MPAPQSSQHSQFLPLTGGNGSAGRLGSRELCARALCPCWCHGSLAQGLWCGAVALRWLVATSCAERHRCQRRHRGTCCRLSGAWTAQIGPDLASAQSLLRALPAPRSLFLPPARGTLYDPEDRQLPTRLACGVCFVSVLSAFRFQWLGSSGKCMFSFAC